MLFRMHVPGPPLAEWVRALWYAEQPAGPQRLERVLPGGDFALIVNLHTDAIQAYDRHDPRRSTRQRGTLLVGASDAWEVIDSACQQRVVGVQFRAGGAWPFLGFPASELNGIEVELDRVWGADGDALRERLCAVAPGARDAGEARTRGAGGERERGGIPASERGSGADGGGGGSGSSGSSGSANGIREDGVRELFRVLEAALRARLAGAGGRMRHRAVTHALRRFRAAPEAVRVMEVVAETGLSARRFITLFEAEVGLTPKRYVRVQRFQRAVQQLHGATARVDLAALAQACGYCDQAHLNHDFRALAGLSPLAYVARRGRHANHVAWEAAGAGRDGAASSKISNTGRAPRDSLVAT